MKTEKLLYKIFNDAENIILDYAWPKNCTFSQACEYGYLEKITKGNFLKNTSTSDEFKSVFGFKDHSIKFINNDCAGGLYYACKGGQLNIANFMIKQGNLEKGDRCFDRALEAACFGGHLEACQLMIKYGADDYLRGLECACLGSHLEICKLMINLGTEMKYSWAFGFACGNNDRDIIDLLIENGANDFGSGLSYACKGGHKSIVNLIIKLEKESERIYKFWECREPIFNKGLTSACGYGHRDLVNLMIEHGAYNFDKGLYAACSGGQKDIAELMIKKLNGRTNMNGRYIFNDALQSACHNGHLDLAELMIENGAYQFNWGLTVACIDGHHDIINRMIDLGADNFNGALKCACRRGHKDIVNLMIEHGANDFNGGLECACFEGDLDLVELMIECGVTIEGLNKGAKSAFGTCHNNLVRLMVKHGAEDKPHYIK